MNENVYNVSASPAVNAVICRFQPLALIFRQRQIITGTRQQVGTLNQTTGAHSPWIPVSAMARSGIQKRPQSAPAKRQAKRASKSVFFDMFFMEFPSQLQLLWRNFLTTGKFLVN
tara:strand:- start:186 stop:530 length:345 start_codon:yes stop_codon:yes gene_type:complete